MPSFVPDASVTLPWCFEDERTPFTESLLNRLRGRETALVPSHWSIEVLNSLVQAKKRGRVSEEKIQRFLRDLNSLPILVDQKQKLILWERVRLLADTHRFTAYDAGYLELAQRTGLPLATVDRELKNAAHAEHVPVLEAAAAL
jgi:predicted nucleic acid-binding protein